MVFLPTRILFRRQICFASRPSWLLATQEETPGSAVHVQDERLASLTLCSILYIRFFLCPMSGCRWWGMWLLVRSGGVSCPDTVPYYVRQRAINTPVFKTILRAHLASDDWRSRTIPIATKQFCKAQCSQGVFTE